MLPVPLRSLFRSRWAALLWAGGICLSAANVAGSGTGVEVDAANATADAPAQQSALDAEDPD